MHFSQSNDRLEKTYRSFIQTGGMTIVAAAIVLAATAILSGGCKTMEPSSLLTKATRMLAELDTIESATAAIVLMEIDKTGECTLYQRMCFANPADSPLESLPGVGSFKAIPLFSVGGEEATIEFGDYLPNGIERQFTANLRTPVPPGEWIDMMMVGEGVAKYKVKESEDGLWRFGPAEGHGGSDIDWVFAVRLPRGARIANVEPKPDEIRESLTDTLIWRKSPSGQEEIGVSIEYRIDGN